jgi:hypothetical protein
MKTLQEVVKEVVSSFIMSETLFTALDVSNKVKETMPFARHREVRDEVRNCYSTDIEPNSYARTPIRVTLADGSGADALLYHPLSDSWDLDTKYSDQQRQSTAAPKAALNPVLAAQGPQQAPQPIAAKATGPGPTPGVSSTARQLWSQMFGAQPSLFPRK